MHLVSLKDQAVRLSGHTFRFAEGETIHTENSYKYTIPGLQQLAGKAGFVPMRAWTDPKQLFALHYLRAE